MKTIELRSAILEYVITEHLKKGWILTSKTETTCQMSRDKKPDGCLTIILICLFVIPGIIYLFLFRKGTETIYLEIDEEGIIKYTGNDLSPHEVEVLNKNSALLQNKIVVSNLKAKDSEAAKNLGLLTTITIASGLNLSDEEVIKLIDSGQLKGKKIGDKYFVRKEDFDEFMKK